MHQIIQRLKALTPDQLDADLVRKIGVAFARIWTLNEAEQMLELRASAGLYTHIDGPHGRVPVGMYKIGKIAEERAPWYGSEDLALIPEREERGAKPA